MQHTTPPDLQNRMLTHDRLAAQFDELMNPYDITRRLEVLIDEFLSGVSLQNKYVLDAGCGTGRGTSRLAQQGADVIAIDLGINLVRYTRERYVCKPTVGSILELPFANGAFDVVFSTEVIEHTPDPYAALREMYRVVKPGGHLVVSTPGWLWQWPVRLASKLGLRPYDGLENFLKTSEVRRVLVECGATVIEHRGIHLLPFQIAFLHPLLRWSDRFGKTLLPIMINQCIHCLKPLSHVS